MVNHFNELIQVHFASCFFEVIFHLFPLLLLMVNAAARPSTQRFLSCGLANMQSWVTERVGCVLQTVEVIAV